MKKTILLAILAVSAMTVSAQGRRSLRINEVMVQNDSNYMDDYGHRSGWIELFNTNHAPLNISSVFITNNPATLNPDLSVKERKAMMYAVPLGDVLTKCPNASTWCSGPTTSDPWHLPH